MTSIVKKQTTSPTSNGEPPAPKTGLQVGSSSPAARSSIETDRIKFKLGGLVTPTTFGDIQTMFTLESRLGKGSYGEVHKAKNNKTGEIVAIKIISLEDEKTLEDVRKEIEMLADCDNPNIVKYLGSHILEDGSLWIVMEYCGGGSATDLVQILETPLSEEQIALICKYSLKGLCYLHSMNRIHRDIKGGNILLTENGHVKLADFGVSAQLFNTFSRRNTFVGTPYYMSPEVIQGYVYDSKADIWSIGITAIELAEIVPPYANVHPMRALFMIPRNPPPQLQDKRAWSANFHDFLTKCLVKDPTKRPDAKELLKHKFLSGLKSRQPLVDLVNRCKQIVSERGYKSKDNQNENFSTAVYNTVGSQNSGTFMERLESSYSTVNVKDEEESSSGTFVDRGTTNFGTFVENSMGTFVENKTEKNKPAPAPKPKVEPKKEAPPIKKVSEIVAANNNNNNIINGVNRAVPLKKTTDVVKPLKRDDSKEKVHPEPPKKDPKLQEELQAIYRKDCTIQIPFLHLSHVSSSSLLATSRNEYKENLQSAFDQLSIGSSNLSLDVIHNKTTLGNLLSVLAYHKNRREIVPMSPAELEQNTKIIRELTSTLKTILRV